MLQVVETVGRSLWPRNARSHENDSGKGSHAPLSANTCSPVRLRSRAVLDGADSRPNQSPCVEVAGGAAIGACGKCRTTTFLIFGLRSSRHQYSSGCGDVAWRTWGSAETIGVDIMFR